MKALVTGGAGFIGSHISQKLLDNGHSVTVIDDFSTGKRSNLPEHKNLNVVECDRRDFDKINHHMRDINWVFHKAAIASVAKTINDPVNSSAVNYHGTLHILEAARNNGVDKLVFASSAALYGDNPVLPKEESMCPVTLSPYAVDKLASEYACGVYSRLYGLKTVCLRYFNVYGPRQDPSSPYSGVISIFNDKLYKSDIPVIYGDGEQTRDFVFVDDVVEANMAAVSNKGASGSVYNIATGDRISLNNLLKTMCAIHNKSFDAIYKENRKGDIRDSYANISRAIEGLGWRPVVSLENGLKALIQSV